MSKFLVTGFIIFIVCFLYFCFEQRNKTVYFNEAGEKVVQATCDKEIDCEILIGQECANAGYKTPILKDQFDAEYTFTAICREDASFLNKIIFKINQ